MEARRAGDPDRVDVSVEVAVTTVAVYGAFAVTVAGVWVGAHAESRASLTPVPAGAGGSFAAPSRGRWTAWNRRLWAEWKPAAILTVLYLSSSIVRGELNPIALGVFCQALIGLAVARTVPGFEALPVVRSLRTRDHFVRAVVLMVVIGAAANVAANLLGSLGLSAGAIAGERSHTGELAGSFDVNAFQAFFVLLGGAGVAEEVMFRLLTVTVVWKLTGRAWLGVVAGATIFAAYHFTPLDGLYRTYWQFPIGALVSNLLVGLVWGFIYVKRGLETAILGHTLVDWVTFVAFVR